MLDSEQKICFELLERIESLNDTQMKEFKNAVSMIIEEKNENMENPEERKKSKKRILQL